MFVRSEIKQSGKLAMKRSYWKNVLVSLILGLTGGGFAVGSRATTQVDVSGSAEAVSMSSERAMEILSSYGPAFIAGFSIGAMAGLLLAILVFYPLTVGCHRYFIINRVQESEISEVAHPFRNGYGNVVKTMFLQELYIFLWSLLFVIPGIIKSYEYRMVSYILAENPNIDSREAFRLSKEMMMGEKWNTFVYDLSFIGWYFLVAFTAGILSVFYVAPYKNCADAELYAVLRDQALGKANA